MRVSPLVLIVLDGWGLSRRQRGNAIAHVKPPVYHHLVAHCPTTRLLTAGEAVGLPRGQMGNSEVGHMTLGSGRIIYQGISRINHAIRDGTFFENAALLGAVRAAREGGRTLHLMGLLSDGGVHSHLDHVQALVRLARRERLDRVAIHAFLDGRDTPPTSGVRYLTTLDRFLTSQGIGRVATVIGRYYAMDRDHRWNRVKKAYDAIVLGKGLHTPSATRAVRAQHQRGVGDEFIEPIIVVDRHDQPIGRLQDGDAVIFFNFRADRARELTGALTLPDFGEFARTAPPKFSAAAVMMSYDARLRIPVAFPPQHLNNLLGQVLAQEGRRQFRIAETEKYAHVTYFFNGGEERVFPGEDRLLIPSPQQVATYDQKPEMSAEEVTREAVERITSRRYDFILMNYANADMVGHTGVWSAAQKAVEVLDRCLKQILTAVERVGGTVLLTADHGNIEQMIDPATGGPHTAHTTNPVPFIVVGPGHVGLRGPGTLADVAPTILTLLRLKVPHEMTGRALTLS